MPGSMGVRRHMSECGSLTLEGSEGLEGEHPPPDGREVAAQAAGGHELRLLLAQRDDALHTRARVRIDLREDGGGTSM